MSTFRRAEALVIFLALLLPSFAAWTAEQATGYMSFVPSEMKWVDAPGSGPGVQMAVIEGDTKAAGPVTFRLNLPPQTRVPVHTHPLIEHVTVMSGTFYFATGDKFDASKAKAYPMGSAIVIPAGMPMFAFTRDEGSMIQIHGVGPWAIHFLHP
jgi:quercetin dioxygenase-like cupin family protein